MTYRFTQCGAELSRRQGGFVSPSPTGLMTSFVQPGYSSGLSVRMSRKLYGLPTRSL